MNANASDTCTLYKYADIDGAFNYHCVAILFVARLWEMYTIRLKQKSKASRRENIALDDN